MATAAAAAAEVATAVAAQSAPVGGDNTAQREHTHKIRNTTGVIVLNIFVYEDNDYYLVMDEDRNDWDKCPKAFKRAWEAAFKNGKAPHTVYFWTEGDLNALFHVCDNLYLTRKQVLTCAALHMIKKNWIPVWAPDTITKGSTFEEVATLSDEFYDRLSSTLAHFTAMIPWAVTFPAEKLMHSEKTMLHTDPDPEELLHVVGNRANAEEACSLPTISCEEGQFLTQNKRNPDDPDTFTYVQARTIDAKGASTFSEVVHAFAEREQISDWRGAHGYFKYFKNFIGDGNIAEWQDFDASFYEKSVKAFRETRNPRLLTAARIRVMGDKKTRAALEVVEEARARKKQRTE